MQQANCCVVDGEGGSAYKKWDEKKSRTDGKDFQKEQARMVQVRSPKINTSLFWNTPLHPPFHPIVFKRGALVDWPDHCPRDLKSTHQPGCFI